VWCLIK